MVQIEWCWFHFQNIHIWPSYGQKMAHMPRLKLLMGTQETIIYRLVVRNPSYNAYFVVLIFWPLLAENGRGHHSRP